MLDEVEPKLVEIQHVAENQGRSIPNKSTLSFDCSFTEGSAGFLQLNHIAAVTHEAETLLDLFRKGKALITAQHTQLLCRTCDCLRHLLGRVETTHSDHDGAAEAKTMSSELAATIAGKPPADRRRRPSNHTRPPPLPPPARPRSPRARTWSICLYRRPPKCSRSPKKA
jgi:two-component system chemotaxis sensor kinase CheA